MGYIVKTISLDTELWNETNRIMKMDEYGFSRYVQSAIRHHNKRIKKRQIIEFVDKLDPNQMDILKNEIKKRG